MRNVNQFKLEPLRKRRDFYLSQQYRRPTMSEPFLQLWMMSAIDIFGISDERRLVRNRLPPKLNIDQIFADGRQQRKAFMVFMIRYSSELPLNPFLKSIFGLPNAACARSRPSRRLSVATKLLRRSRI